MIDSIINYSIIIPHKNIPKLLRRCLDSIPKRDDVQIIVVDDNSDSSIVDFSNFPGKSEYNTEVYYTKEGKGAGFARNIGLQKAKGKWLLFADADDFFNEWINQLLDKYINADAEIIFFRSDSAECDTLKPIMSRGSHYNRWIEESLVKGEIIEEVRYCINSVWAKIFSKQFIFDNNILFDEVFTANDVMFSTKSGFLAKKISLDLNYLYCSTSRMNSLDKLQTYDHIKSRFDIALENYKFLKSIGKAQYRSNIVSYIKLSRKFNITWIKDFIIPALKTMKLSHISSDIAALFKRKLNLL